MCHENGSSRRRRTLQCSLLNITYGVWDEPYYGVKFTVVATGEGSAGLLINDKANVLDINFQPIKGLFACGNSAAYLDIGSGYQSGFANCRGMTFAPGPLARWSPEERRPGEGGSTPAQD